MGNFNTDRQILTVFGTTRRYMYTSRGTCCSCTVFCDTQSHQAWFSSVSGHKQKGDHAITKQKPLQNDFLTQHLYSAQNTRYVTLAVQKYWTAYLYPLEAEGSWRNPDEVQLAHRKQQTRTKSGTSMVGFLFSGLFLFFKDVKLWTSTPTLTVLLT